MHTAKPVSIIPDIFSEYLHVIASQSTRHGGISPYPFSSLNLGLYTDDQPANVQKNRQLFYNRLGIDGSSVAHSRQIHGDRILRVEKAGAYDGYDALITNQPNIFCSITIADCTPILIYDPENQAVAAIHAGWRGTAQQIVFKTLIDMQKAFGTHSEHCIAYIGTCIDECSYEVGKEVAEHFPSRHKRFDAESRKFFLNLKRANKDQLLAAGLLESKIEVSPHCTFMQNDDYFSHRKEKGQTGRMLAIVGIKA